MFSIKRRGKRGSGDLTPCQTHNPQTSQGRSFCTKGGEGSTRWLRRRSKRRNFKENRSLIYTRSPGNGRTAQCLAKKQSGELGHAENVPKIANNNNGGEEIICTERRAHTKGVQERNKMALCASQIARREGKYQWERGRG